MSWYTEKGADGDIVISTRVRLARNIKGVPFPPKMTDEDGEKVITLVRAALDKGAAFKDFKFVKMEKLSQNERLALIEKHLISAELSKKSGAALISPDERISIMLNEEDHIRIQCLLPGFNPEGAYDMANKIDSLLEESLSFAFHEKYGYLTCCPTNTGTGMRASAMVHLPALSLGGAAGALLNSAGKIGMTVRGLYGEGTEAYGYFYQISNQITLGISEEDILKKLRDVICEVAKKERRLRDGLSQNAALRDRIMRSYGIMLNAYMLSSAEFMKALSDVKMGVEMGIIKNIPSETLNRLMVITQPAGLTLSGGGAETPEQRDILRAKLVQDELRK